MALIVVLTGYFAVSATARAASGLTSSVATARSDPASATSIPSATDYFVDLLTRQMQGTGGYSFHLWTVMNAVLWHESWIAGNESCF